MFKRTHVIDPCVLDLCVFNDDGVAKIGPATVCPSRLMPAWKKRFELSRQRAERILKRYQNFAQGKAQGDALTAIRNDLINLFPPVVSNSSIFKATIDLNQGGQIEFNCKRVKRLSHQRAIALALQYSSCFNRPAFERDMT